MHVLCHAGSSFACMRCGMPGALLHACAEVPAAFCMHALVRVPKGSIKKTAYIRAGKRELCIGSPQVRLAQQASVRAGRAPPSLLADFNIARKTAEQQWQARIRRMPAEGLLSLTGTNVTPSAGHLHICGRNGSQLGSDAHALLLHCRRC